jgi:hypothetical protein
VNFLSNGDLLFFQHDFDSFFLIIKYYENIGKQVSAQTFTLCNLQRSKARTNANNPEMPPKIAAIVAPLYIAKNIIKTLAPTNTPEIE